MFICVYLVRQIMQMDAPMCNVIVHDICEFPYAGKR